MKIDYTWHQAPEELPLHEAVCVTYHNGSYRINVWNPYDQCWDDEQGDDSEMDADTKLRWMALETEGDE